MDANAKIPSGLLRGNGNQFGDFDLCTGIRTKVKIKDDKSVKIRGKYCLANIEVAAEDEQLKMSIHLLQSRNFLRNRLDDVSRISFCDFLAISFDIKSHWGNFVHFLLLR